MKAYTFIAILFLFFINSCKKDNQQECPTFSGYLLPYTLYFVPKTNGNKLPDSVLDKLKLYYLENNTKQYINDFGRAGDNGHNLGVLLTRDIGDKSADNNIKDFYLEFANGDIDTLYVDYRHYSSCQADTSACQCLYPRFLVKYNGQVANYDSTITEQSVYLFNKF